ncbi:hypothetical protein Aperf_G00000011523 [Anoplocephala perfoliata]
METTGRKLAHSVFEPTCDAANGKDSSDSHILVRNLMTYFSDWLASLGRWTSIAFLPMKICKHERAAIFGCRRVKNVKKIGEGVYSDVFGFSNEDTVVKLIPFEGTFIFHGRQQLRVSQILSEVIATSSSCHTKWFAMEFNECGHTLRGELTVLAVAVAERELCLEHHDLHMDNILIRPIVRGQMGSDCESEGPSSTLDGIVDQPCSGPPVSIIDFTFSRFDINECFHFVELIKISFISLRANIIHKIFEVLLLLMIRLIRQQTLVFIIVLNSVRKFDLTSLPTLEIANRNGKLNGGMQHGASGNYKKRFQPRGNCIWFGGDRRFFGDGEAGFSMRCASFCQCGGKVGCHLESAEAKYCLGLDMTCGDYISIPCCRGMFCRKLRDGVKYGLCSISYAELVELNRTDILRLPIPEALRELEKL